jgi:nitrite reductase (NO-forming) / hydroxylamine reductase
VKLQRAELATGIVGGAFLLLIVGSLVGCPAEQKAPGGTASATPDGGKAIFDGKCLACHTIGKGDGVGPDLMGVTGRREKAWLVKWLKDPAGMLETDAVAKEMLKKYKNIPMPNQQLSDAEIESLLGYLASAKKEEAVKLTLAADIGGRSIPDFVASECGGCHNPRRLGATGPDITKARLHDGTEKLGPMNLDSILAAIKHGRKGTVMPAWNTVQNPIGRALTDPEINALGTYIWENEAPAEFHYSLEQMKKTHEVMIAEKDRPAKPTHSSKMDNLLLVTERENFSVAVIDGDSLELIAHMKAGARAHGYTFHPDGRYAYNLGRDGWLYMYDLFTFKAVTKIRTGMDARGIAISDNGKYLLLGMYIPSQATIVDALTLEPLKNFDTSNVKDPNGKMVSSRICSVNDVAPDKVGPYFLMALKEGGQIWRIDYSKPDFPVSKVADVGEILHDGFLTPDNKLFYLASQESNWMAVLEVESMKIIAKIETGLKPHPGTGAVWDSGGKQYAATPHIGEGKQTIWDTATQKIVGEVKSGGPGLFVRTSPHMKYVWFDSVFTNGNEIVVHEKAPPFKVVKKILDGTLTVHPEPGAHGKYVFVSDWKEGVVRVYDDKTCELKKTITGFTTPTGIFSISRLHETEGH